MVRHKTDHWKYSVSDIGFNYRLSDINCSLALSQLNKIKKFISYRKKIYKNYVKSLNNFIKFPIYNKNNESAYHLFLISINFKKYKITKDTFLRYFRKKNLFFQYHYIPIYKFKLFKKKNFILKGSETYFNNSLSIPIYYNLNFKSQKKIIDTIKNYLRTRISI